MRLLLNKILSGKLGVGKFIIASVAFILGLGLVLISVQCYYKLNEYLNPSKNFSGYLLLNKEVGLGHTIFGGKAEFKNDDIEDLKQQPFVEDIGTFQSSKFKVRVDVTQFGFSTEAFFESVPTRFIEDAPREFQWSTGDDLVPIIINQDFLNLYNFGYAQGRGSRQVSKSTAKLIPLQVEISGPQGSQLFDAKVVGFSERIPSILAPESFIEWANKNIAGQSSTGTSRVIIKIKGDKSSLVESYLEDHDLTVGEDKLMLSRISNIVTIVMTILFIIGFAFLIFALVIVVMNFSLIVSEAKNEVQLLLHLGYKRVYLFHHLIIYLILFLLIALAGSIALFVLCNSLFIKFASENGLSLSQTIENPVYTAGILFVSIAFLLSMSFIYRLLRK